MKILFCGTVVPEKIEYQISNISAAGNRFQNNMIYNLKKLGHDVYVVSYVAFEISKELRDELLDGNSSYKDEGKKYHYIIRQGRGCKAIFQTIKKCKDMIQKHISEFDVILCYNVFYSFLFLPQYADRFQKESILILADYSGPESFHSIRNKVYAKVQKRVIRQYNMVVGLSENVQRILRPKQRFILMEGGIDEGFYSRFAERNIRDKREVVFMYSGLLSTVTGVDILLQTVTEMRGSGFKLWISGKGDLEKQVRDIAEKDKRICYLGHMRYDEYIEALKQADVLINPRNMDLPENQNNFPSKIMDYLATGKTIISSKFVGWEKFSENIIFYDDTAMLEQKMEMCISGNYVGECSYEKNRNVAVNFLWKNQLMRILGTDR